MNFDIYLHHAFIASELASTCTLSAITTSSLLPVDPFSAESLNFEYSSCHHAFSKRLDENNLIACMYVTHSAPVEKIPFLGEDLDHLANM